VALPVLRHRVRLAADLEIEGARTDAVLAQLLADVEAPRA
jgi:MoxR-like ATPase